jgi:hypothetical protein
MFRKEGALQIVFGFFSPVIEGKGRFSVWLDISICLVLLYDQVMG